MWREVPLGEVIALQRGIDTTRATQRPGRVPVISSGGISSFRADAWTSGPGVVMGRKGTLGRVFYVDEPYWPHDTTLWVTDFKGNAPRFIYYLLQRIDVAAMDVGSASPTLNRNHLYPLEVTIPSVAEQEAIAEVLGALDDKIAANGPLIDTAERLMIALVEGLEATTTLGALAVLSKKQISPADLGSLPVSHYSLPAFDQSRLPTIEPGVSILSGKFALERPSVLLSKLNPRFPRVWNVQSPEERSVASTEFLVLHPQGVPTAALWAILARASTQTFLAGRVSGTSGSHQRVRPQEALQIPVPDVRQFDPSLNARLVALSDAVDTARRESRTLAQLRDTLLPALMDGTLRVKDAVAQAEEVL